MMKKKKVDEEDAEDELKVAYHKFIQTHQQSGSLDLLTPRVINFVRRAQYLYNQSLSYEQGKAVRCFLESLSREN